MRLISHANMGPEGLVSEHVLQVEVLAVAVELGMQPTQIRPKRGVQADNITLGAVRERVTSIRPEKNNVPVAFGAVQR